MVWAKSVLLLLSLSLVSCITVPERVLVQNVEPPLAVNFNLVDARPVEQVRGGKHEFTYATWWIYGDDRFSTPPLQVLKAELAKAFPSQLNGKTVKVEKFEVSLSQTKANSSRGNAYVPSVPSTGSLAGDILGAALGGLLIAAIESSKNNAMVGTVIGVEIEGTKIEHTERSTLESENPDRQLSDNLNKAISGFTRELAQNIEKKPSTTVDAPEADIVESGAPK